MDSCGEWRLVESKNALDCGQYAMDSQFRRTSTSFVDGCCLFRLLLNAFERESVRGVLEAEAIAFGRSTVSRVLLGADPPTEFPPD